MPIPDGILVTLEDAKFSDGSISKIFAYGDEVEITAVVPEGYTDYIGNLTCSNPEDNGKIKTKVQYEYSFDGWNIDDSKNQTITYHVMGNNVNIKAVIKKTTTELNKYECTSHAAIYHAAYYNCPNGGNLSGTTCSSSSSYAATCGSRYCEGDSFLMTDGVTCRHATGGACNGNYLGHTCTSKFFGDGGVHCYCDWTAPCSYTCPSGGSLSGSTCYKSSSYNATYHAAYYECTSGTLSGENCYELQEKN